MKLSDRLASRVVWFISLVHLAIPLRHIVAGVYPTHVFLTNDDTYYYLQTAWNTRHLGFVTFDGINATNGVQFLWFAMTYALSWLTEDKGTFLLFASTLSVALTWLPYLVMSRLARSQMPSGSLLSVVMASLWLIICMYPPNQYLVAMESAVHALMIWLIVWQFVSIHETVQSRQLTSTSVMVFITLLVLNAWARLDSGALSATFFVLTWQITRDSALSRTTWISGLVVVGLGIVGLFGFFWLAGGSVLPVSALVKGHDVDRFSLGAFYNWSLVLFPLRIPGANLLNILGILSFFASVAALVTMKPRADAHQWSALRLAALGLACAVFIHSVATFGMFRYYYFWYLSASFVYWTIALAIFVSERAARSTWNHRRVSLASAGLAVGVAVLSAATDKPNDLAFARYQAARWIDANLERDAVIASFNAGQLGFWANRSVVNLDGLINNVSYYQTVLRTESPAALAAYLDRTGIDYLVDYQFGPWGEVIEGKFAAVREFQLASGGTLKVMARKSAR